MKSSLLLVNFTIILCLVSCSPTKVVEDIRVSQAPELNVITPLNETTEAKGVGTLGAPAVLSSQTIAPTETPFPLEEGWRDYAMPGFRLALPESWEVVEVDPANVDEIWKKLEEVDAEWVSTFKSLFTSKYVQESIKLWANDVSTAVDGQGNLVVVSQKLPAIFSNENLCQKLKATYELLGGRIIDSTCDMQINGLKAHRFTLRIRVGAHSLKQRLYLYENDRQVWVINAYVSGKGWRLYDPIFDLIAQTFRID